MLFLYWVAGYIFLGPNVIQQHPTTYPSLVRYSRVESSLLVSSCSRCWHPQACGEILTHHTHIKETFSMDSGISTSNLHKLVYPFMVNHHHPSSSQINLQFLGDFFPTIFRHTQYSPIPIKVESDLSRPRHRWIVSYYIYFYVFFNDKILIYHKIDKILTMCVVWSPPLFAASITLCVGYLPICLLVKLPFFSVTLW